jgi:hypothetical protein
MLLAYHESMYKVELMGRLSLKNEWLLNPLIDTETIKRMKEIDERLKDEGIDIELQLSAMARKIFKLDEAST